jgi:glycosyltransferase involved in cell wall biosynthesis
MHLVTVAPSVPDPSTGGGGNWNGSLIRYFSAAGHRVTHVAVVGKHASIGVDQRAMQEYSRLGIEVIVVPYRKRQAVHRNFARALATVLRPSIAELWPDEWNTRPHVLKIIEEKKPDCVLPFAFDAVVYTHGLRTAPRVAFQAEGPHINTYVNWKYDPAVMPGVSVEYGAYSLRTLLLKHLQERMYAALTRDLTIAAFAGPHYVEWAKRKGLSNASFITTPVTDPVGNRWEEMRSTMPANPKCRILMIGHLHSTSNRSGLPIFFHELLPSLERIWHPDRFEIHIVGRNESMPKRFDSWRDHPSLKFRGPVFPAHDEFLRSDILLVTVPARTGSRVRILNGFSYGCCVVAHTANALGIPELKHDENALLADTGDGLARQIVRAAEDSQLRRRLGRNARTTYEQFYTERAGGEQYMRYIERALTLFHSSTAK